MDFINDAIIQKLLDNIAKLKRENEALYQRVIEAEKYKKENDVLNERIKILEETMDALEAQIDVMLIEMQEENEMKDKLIKELEAQVFKDFIIKLINDKTHED